MGCLAAVHGSETKSACGCNLIPHQGPPILYLISLFTLNFQRASSLSNNQIRLHNLFDIGYSALLLFFAKCFVLPLDMLPKGQPNTRLREISGSLELLCSTRFFVFFCLLSTRGAVPYYTCIIYICICITFYSYCILSQHHLHRGFRTTCHIANRRTCRLGSAFLIMAS